MLNYFLVDDGKWRRTSRYTLLKRYKNKGSDNLDHSELLESLTAKLKNQCTFKYSIKTKDGSLDPCVHLEHADYLDKFHEDVVQCLKGEIENLLGDVASIATCNDHLKDDVACHIHRHKQYCHNNNMHVNDIVEKVLGMHPKQNQCKTPVLLYGGEGCGKSTVISHVCQHLQMTKDKETVLIIRYAGLTHASMTDQMLLFSICSHIQHILGEPCLMPLDHHSLISRYKDLLKRLELDRRNWIIAIDDLDYVFSDASSNSHTDQYKWIGLSLPVNVTFLATVMATPGKEELLRFEKLIPAESYVKIPELNDKDIECFVGPINTTKHESSSPNQTNMANIMKGCPNPLFCKLLQANARCSTDVALNTTALGDSLESAINHRVVFLVERYGTPIALAVLRYLSATQSGITEQELLDVLSCNNIVMVHVIDVTTADQIRFPYATWLRIKEDLGK